MILGMILETPSWLTEVDGPVIELLLNKMAASTGLKKSAKHIRNAPGLCLCSTRVKNRDAETCRLIPLEEKHVLTQHNAARTAPVSSTEQRPCDCTERQFFLFQQKALCFQDVIRVPLWVELIWTCLFLFSVQLLQYFVGLLLCFQKKKTYIKQNKWVKCFFFFLLLSPQITEKWPSFLQADTSFPSASSCPKRHWSPPLRGNTAASVIGSKWSSTDPGPQSGNSRRSSQSSSPSTSTLQLYWWGCCSINVSSPPARFSAQFRAPAHWLLSFTGATGWNKGQNGPSMVPQLRTGVGNSENRPQGLHTW